MTNRDSGVTGQNSAGPCSTQRRSEPRTLGVRLLLFLFVLSILLIFPVRSVLAACSNPAGTAGKWIYSADWRVAQFCDGTNWIAAGQPQYNPVAVAFDGIAAYLSQASNMTPDNAKVSGSFWFRRAATGQQTIYRIQRTTTYSAARLRFIIEFDVGNKLHVSSQSADSTAQVNLVTTPAYTDTNWHHALFSLDLSGGSGACSIYVDGASVALTTSTCPGSSSFDFTPTPSGTNQHTIGAGSDTAASGNKYKGDLADFWFDVGTALSLPNDKGKFITSAGKPVYTGATGSTPTGASPEILLSGALLTWENNDGTAVSFNNNGYVALSAYPMGDVPSAVEIQRRLG